MNAVSHRPGWAWVLGLTALAYALTGWLALKLAVAPGYATSLYPAAGIALAAALVYGRAAVAGVALGALAVNLGLSAARGPLDLAGLLVPVAIGAGAALQAQAGRWLVQRYVAMPLNLTLPRDIWRFLLLAGPVACGVNASLSTLTLGVSGLVPVNALPFTGWTWWIGDSLGVLIGAPAVLALIGQPRNAWAPRRSTVALPLAAVTLLLVAATLVVNRWDEQRLQQAFDGEAAAATKAVNHWLNGPLHALQAVHGVLAVHPQLTRDVHRLASAWWLQQPLYLQAVGYSERVKRAELPRFEALARADGPADYRVFDHPDHPKQLGGADEDMVAVRYIEPEHRNTGALGVNALSIEAAADAIRRAQRSGQPSASRGFRLTQEPGEQVGVVIYLAMYQGPADAEAQRLVSFRGVGFVTLRMGDAMNAVMQPHQGPLNWCLVEREDPQRLRRLAGPTGCEAVQRLAYSVDRPLAFAGRDWQLRLDAGPLQIAASRPGNAWLFSVLGLLSAALLGALLLIVTGRTQRIELAVDERTRALGLEAAQHQRTAHALRGSEQQLQAILDTAQVGIVKTDLHGRILKTNAAYCRLLGFSESELLQQKVGQFTHPDDRAQDAMLLAAMQRGDSEVYRREKRYLSKHGAVVPVQLTVALLRDAQGQPQCTVGVVEDISEHLQLAEAERARDQAESSNRAKSEFVSRMSHELRTPLNAMLGFAQLLGLDRRPALAGHQRVWATQIQQAGWHLLHMINDTLDLSRIEAGMLELKPVPLATTALVDAALALVQPIAEKRGLTIGQHIDERAVTVLGDETRIKQVLTNLLSNAVKYNVDGGRIDIKARIAEADAVEIAISDTGLGMTRAQMDDLFTPYNRLGRERSAVEGTGIGLVISRRLAELMGGSLRAHSVAGEGSTFLLTLPSAAAADSPQPSDGEEPIHPVDYHQRLVHYIEDNETNVEVMRGMLQRRPQVLLSVSMNGLDGLAAIRQRRPSLILLDMHLPDIDGLELLKHLQADDSLCSIPVVVVSADATAAHMEAALTAGAAHYVTKPVNLASFLGVLDDLLDETDTFFG